MVKYSCDRRGVGIASHTFANRLARLAAYPIRHLPFTIHFLALFFFSLEENAKRSEEE